jgi:hypothetical protein
LIISLEWRITNKKKESKIKFQIFEGSNYESDPNKEDSVILNFQMTMKLPAVKT